jgi:hypothetical protein
MGTLFIGMIGNSDTRDARVFGQLHGRSLIG